MIRKLLRDYFSLTRGERRGMQVLSLLIILLLIFRAAVPLLINRGEELLGQAEKDFIASHDSLMMLDARINHAGQTSLDLPAGEGQHPFRTFPFDPNTASFQELISLGLPSRTARILINYREAGGKFRRDSDLLRVYGMDPDLYGSLQDYIRINPAGNFPSGRELDGTGDSSCDPGGEETTGSFHSSAAILNFELNRADSLQLLKVYGIGPVFARRIIRYRQALGGYYSSNQLDEIYGISPAQKKELAACINIDTSLLKRMDINSVEAEELARHPYLNRYQSHAIIAYRNQMGSYKHLDELEENGILPDSVFLRIRPYMYAEGL